MCRKVVCHDIAELPEIAEFIINTFSEKRIFIFKGELGSGKTTLIKAICSLLKVDDLTNSPSFSIVNEYHTENGAMIYHFDFYRIENIKEVYDIGYEEYFYSGNYCFVEWPEIAEKILPPGHIEIGIEIQEDKKTRVISFEEKNS